MVLTIRRFFRLRSGAPYTLPGQDMIRGLTIVVGGGYSLWLAGMIAKTSSRVLANAQDASCADL
jgi:hypothetical protein